MYAEEKQKQNRNDESGVADYISCRHVFMTFILIFSFLPKQIAFHFSMPPNHIYSERLERKFMKLDRNVDAGLLFGQPQSLRFPKLLFMVSQAS